MRHKPSPYPTVLLGAAFAVVLTALLVLVVNSRHHPEISTATGQESACLDFVTRQEAQAFYQAEGGPETDVHGLDADRDGVACERIRTDASDDRVRLAQATGTGTPTTTVAGRSGPRSTGLPKTGSRVENTAIIALGLIAMGLFLVTATSMRSLVLARRRWDHYDNIGW